MKIHIFLEIQVFVGSNVTGVQIDFTYSHIYRVLSKTWQIFENWEKFWRSNSHIHIFWGFLGSQKICEYVKLTPPAGLRAAGCTKKWFKTAAKPNFGLTAVSIQGIASCGSHIVPSALNPSEKYSSPHNTLYKLSIHRSTQEIKKIKLWAYGPTLEGP